MACCDSVSVECRFLVLGAVWRSITYTNRVTTEVVSIQAMRRTRLNTPWGAPDSTHHGQAHENSVCVREESVTGTAMAPHTHGMAIKHTAHGSR